MAAPWDELAELAEREHDVVEAGRWQELPALQEARRQVMESVTDPPPAAAADPLAAALAQSRETELALRDELERTRSRIDALRRGRRVAAAYGVPRRSGIEARA